MKEDRLGRGVSGGEKEGGRRDSGRIERLVAAAAAAAAPAAATSH